MGIWRGSSKSGRAGFNRNFSISIPAREAGYSVGEHYRGLTLLLSTRPASRALSAVGWISAAVRSPDWSRSIVGGDAEAERSFPQLDRGRDGLYIPAGFPA